MSRTNLVGRTEILGPAFVGKEELEASRECGGPERRAVERRLSTSGYNSHWGYLVRGEVGGGKYEQMVAAVRKAGRVTEPQLETLTRELLKTVDPTGTSPHRDSLRTILRENLTRNGVKVTKS